MPSFVRSSSVEQMNTQNHQPKVSGAPDLVQYYIEKRIPNGLALSCPGLDIAFNIVDSIESDCQRYSSQEP